MIFTVLTDKTHLPCRLWPETKPSILIVFDHKTSLGHNCEIYRMMVRQSLIRKPNSKFGSLLIKILTTVCLWKTITVHSCIEKDLTNFFDYKIYRKKMTAIPRQEIFRAATKLFETYCCSDGYVCTVWIVPEKLIILILSMIRVVLKKKFFGGDETGAS